MIYPPEPIETEQVKREVPALGTWFTVKAIAEKIHDNETEQCTNWKRRRIDAKRMMFIGVRQVREGVMVDDEKIYRDSEGMGVDIDYFRSFHATRFITCWLFVASAHSNPIHVLPVDAEAVP